MSDDFNIPHSVLQNLKANLSNEDKEKFLALFRKETFRRKEVIFRNGDANTRHYFIEKGLLRMYLIDQAGKEFNILFAKEKQVIGDLNSPNPTNFNLQAIEDTTLYSLDNNAIQSLSGVLNETNLLESNSHLRRSYIFIQQRLVSILSKSAEENYLEFKQRHPDLIQRIPQYHIASYLGVSAEFLSKIIARTAKM
jgi:CRP-like cAMP-binding protein